MCGVEGESYVLAPSSNGTVDQMSVQPTLCHQPQQLLGSVTVTLPRRVNRVDELAGGVREITNHFHFACRDQGSVFAAAAVFGANTPLFGAVDAFGAVAVVTGIWGASDCCR